MPDGIEEVSWRIAALKGATVGEVIKATTGTTTEFYNLQE